MSNSVTSSIEPVSAEAFEAFVNAQTLQSVLGVEPKCFDTRDKTLGERIDGATEETFEFKKFRSNAHTGDPTGMVLKTNRVNGLTVIDIDMDKSQMKPLIDAIRNAILMILPTDSIVVKSASGGLHIYCNTGDYKATSNRNCDACEQTPYGNIIKGIDLIGSVDVFSQSGLMFAGSRVKTTESGDNELLYEFVRGGLDDVIKYDVLDILKILSFKLKQHVKPVTPPCESMDCDETLAKALVNGLSGFKVHGLGAKRIDDGVCLFTLCRGINALPDEFIDEAYEHVREHCTFTAHASEHFEDARQRNEGMSSPGNIIKIVRVHNPEYYNTNVKSLVAARFVRQNDASTVGFTDSFDVIHDAFLIKDIRAKCPYSDINEAKTDLLRILRVIDTTPATYMIKQYNGIKQIHEISYVKKDAAREKLSEVVVCTQLENNRMKNITLWDIFSKNQTVFHIDGLAFYKEDVNVFNFFRGYEYSVLETVKTEVIQPFLDHVHNVIADGNEEVYTYILTWIASILQTPNYKTGVGLVLLGKQGTGKNVFTNVICKLMTRYAAENVTSVESIVGKFNTMLENKKLIILNEMQDADANKHLNSQALKTLFTETDVLINQKGITERPAENVANFIFCSNNMQPVKIERSDRRYMVTVTSDKHANDKKHFKSLTSSFTPEFYENLFTYFMLRNTTGFDTQKIPDTESRRNIQLASASNCELFIREYYADIVNMKGDDLVELYDRYALRDGCAKMGKKTLFAQLSEWTIYKQKKFNGKSIWVFNIKPEYIEKFKAADDALEEVFSDDAEP